MTSDQSGTKAEPFDAIAEILESYKEQSLDERRPGQAEAIDKAVLDFSAHMNGIAQATTDSTTEVLALRQKVKMLMKRRAHSDVLCQCCDLLESLDRKDQAAVASYLYLQFRPTTKEEKQT